MFKKIYIEITNICNLNCQFCKDTHRQKQFMSLTNFEKIIQKIKGHTNLVFLHVKGEPLLHPNLDGILKILEKYHLQANITTNGTLLLEKLDILKERKAIRQLNISIHSFTQNKNLKEQYLKDVLEAVDQLENKIISYRLWNLQKYTENKMNQQIISLLESHYQQKNLIEQLRTNSFYKLKDQVFINQDIEFSWPDLQSSRIINQGKCLALKSHLAVLVDGTIVPCCLDNNGDIPLGNILEESLEEVLNKPKTRLIKKNFEQGKITCDLCYTCGFLKRLEKKRQNK